MTSLFGFRRRAEVFAARADEAISGRRTIREDGTAAPSPETEALLDLVLMLRSVGADDALATPGEGFSSDLRDRLVTEASTVLVAPLVHQPHAASTGRGSTARGSTGRGRGKHKRRFVTATATVAIIMGGSAGMASAAQESLPGQALYPVKRGLERAAVTFSASSLDRGRELLTQASGRLEEVQGLMDAGAAERTQIPGTLDTFNSQAREGADLLMSSYQSTDDETTVATLRDFTASSMGTIEDLASTAPDQAMTSLGDAAVLMEDVDTAANQVCPTCSDRPALPASDVLSLTTAAGTLGAAGTVGEAGTVGSAGTVGAAGTVGFPGPGVGQDGSGLLGLTSGEPAAVPGATLAPLLPGLPAGQVLLGVPGAPAPLAAGGSTAVPGTTPGEEPVDGDLPSGSDPGTLPTPGIEAPDEVLPGPDDPQPQQPSPPAEPPPAEPTPPPAEPTPPPPADPTPTPSADPTPTPADPPPEPTPTPADPPPEPPIEPTPTPAAPPPEPPTDSTPTPPTDPGPRTHPGPPVDPGPPTDLAPSPPAAESLPGQPANESVPPPFQP